MTTEQIIRRFLDGSSGSNGRISTDGTNLYSYSTLIAFKSGASVYVTTHTYSVTTSRQVQELWSRLESRDETVTRPVSVSEDKTRGWIDHSKRTPPYQGWKPRKGSVGCRPVDKLDGGHTATFTRAVPRAR